MLYKVSWGLKISILVFSVFIISLGFISSLNTNKFYLILLFCSIICLSLNIPLYLFRVELQGDFVVLNWILFKIIISYYEINYIGKAYDYQGYHQRKLFTYAFVCINEGKEKIYSFPKTSKMNKMINQIRKVNNAVKS